MKFGTLKDPGHWDGQLAVISQDNSQYVKVPEIAKSFREAIEDWANVKDRLKKGFGSKHNPSLF